MNDRELIEHTVYSWFDSIPETEKTHETRIHEISSWFMEKDRASNQEVYDNFPGPKYKKAWECLKKRGVRSTQMFYDDKTKEWVYFP